jgi:ubiquinone/menaquinone biosynthesis C-methylase UbiE/uncharacterized protein YbaR (Trm112 family)
MSTALLSGQDLSAKGIHLACPDCHSILARLKTQLQCITCSKAFEIDRGIPLFYAEDAGVSKSMQAYTNKFCLADTAWAYRASFTDDLRKRWRTLHENRLLSKLLAESPTQSILNIPCGSGRLSRPLAERHGLLIEADSSAAQLHLNMEANHSGRAFLNASALAIPLPTDSIDTVVCARLSHHMNRSQDRDNLMAELLRVARNHVIYSFRDYASVSVYSRLLRQREAHATAMKRSEVRAMALKHHAKVLKIASVSKLGARHSYALIKKNPKHPIGHGD